MYSRPSASHTRYPCARVMRVGSPPSRPSPAAAPNSASGRLLPVDVNPGTRQSLTVFHHLDGHRPHELRLTEDLAGRLARPLQVALGRAAPRREPDDVHAVRHRVLEPPELRHASHHVLRLVRDPGDAIGVVLARIDEPQVAQPEIL